MRCWVQAPDLQQETRTGSDTKQSLDIALQQQVGGNGSAFQHDLLGPSY